MTKSIKAYGLLGILIILAGAGIAVTVKADVGVGPWDAMSLTFSYLTGLKIGTLGIIFNFICLIGQKILLGKDFKNSSIWQIVVSILLGIAINFFAYTAFKNLVFPNYIIRLTASITSTVFLAAVIGAIVVLGITSFALEGFCSAVHRKTGIPFGKFRQWVDFFCVTVSIILTFIFSLKWSLREGTIISMLLFGPLMGIFMPKIEKMFEKWGIVDGKSELEKEIEEME
ncbi:hypothetical protein EII29_07260 [Leptotrichia sp. OH3620_COT-345]|uniref:YczE/YyaS/YitT family protein n=1 Tax=Leptotrichia sp. OH3620_COT-345 TaxID=2491048 RepID=UPI000F651B85|nr:hypothetical protein [Leptotrichia sp. OH3620_COT-345]RRD39378.1 hypothetical protein EII29_07260 [Leptotrichia sp. OH3620_COT-345]